MSEVERDKTLGTAEANNSAQWISPFETLLGTDAAMPNNSTVFQQPDPTIGTPDADSSFFPGQQSYPDTCAIRCQEFVLEQFTGMDFDETALVQECQQNGWYAPGGGTSPEDVGNLLEAHGVAVNRYANANIFNLASELAQGHKVIIGVDSGELWKQHPILENIEDFFGINGADHAVVISGIDTSDPNQTYVIVSDPGTGEAVARYPMEQFLDAWQDSDFFMVATQQPAPSYLPEMVNFPYDVGHIPEVSGIPYDQFVGLEDSPQLWDELLTAPPEESSFDGITSIEDYNPSTDHFVASETVLPDDNSFTTEPSSFEDPQAHDLPDVNSDY